jgi:metal-responsive CopG/Arc/MetJ family transcriptional regulator
VPQEPLTEGQRGKNPRVVIAFPVASAQLIALDAIATERAVSRSAVVRAAIANYIVEQDTK